MAVLLPAGVLFGQVWRWTGDTRDDITTERDAVTYLVALSQLTVALGDAQSESVAGRTGSRDAVTRGIGAVNAVDSRLGATLKTTERWTTVRDAIESLPKNGGMATYNAFAQVSETLRALYNVVWVNGLLAREPDADAYFLANAGAEAVPQALIAAGRVADLGMLLGTRPAAEVPAAVAALSVAQAALIEAGGDLTEDLQSAVDGNAQGNLTASLLSRLDRFRRAVDTVAVSAVPTGQSRPTVDADQVGKARTDVQAAGADLHAAILRELDALLTTRGDRMDTQRQLAIATFALAAILALVPSFAVLLGRRRPSGRTDRTTPAGSVFVHPGAGEFGPPGEMIGEVSLTRREHSGAR